MKKLLVLAAFLLLVLSCNRKEASTAYRQFTFSSSYRYPGTPEFVYDHLTGDISEWWDHSFSENPYRIFIEAKPGGGFYELFDSTGNGALHATVIAAERGKLLRLDGPLGLAGKALNLVCTYKLEALGADSTLLNLEVHGSGEIEEGLPEVVERVWNHFLGEQFGPYISKKYRSIEASAEFPN